MEINTEKKLMEKGFLTIALGKYFSYLAYNLILSYRLNSNIREDIKIAVVTDIEGAELLKDLYDECIILDNIAPKKYLHKLDIYELSPFEKTIFIDADSMVIRDIAEWFDVFEESRQKFAVWGSNNSIDTPAIQKALASNTAMCPERTIQKYGINYLIAFNGGVYYFEKSDIAKCVFERAKELLNTYHEDGLTTFAGGSMGDEPVMQIAMVQNGIHGIPDPDGIRMFCTPGMSKLKIDVLKQKCRFNKYTRVVTPAFMHWGTDVTRNSPIYWREVLKLRFWYKNQNQSKLVISFLCNAAYPILILQRLAKRISSRIGRRK